MNKRKLKDYFIKVWGRKNKAIKLKILAAAIRKGM